MIVGGTSLVTLCKFLKENKQHSPSDGMKKYFFKKNQQTGLPFAGCKCHPIQEIKKKSSLFYAYLLIFDTLMMTAHSGLRGTGEKSRRATKAEKVRVVSDAFHFKSDEPAFRIFRLGRSARAFGRWGFLFLFSYSLTHTRARTHTHGRTHTWGAFKLCAVGGIYECVCLFLKNSLISDKDTEGKRRCSECGSEKRAQRARSAR